MTKSILGLSHCFMLLACRFVPENSPLTHRYPVLVYARVSLTTRSHLNRCSSFSPHNFVVLHLTWLEQTVLYSLILELPTGMQTVRGIHNTRKQRAVIRRYIHIEFNGEFANTGSSLRHPKRDITETGKIKFHCTLLGKGYWALTHTYIHTHTHSLSHTHTYTLTHIHTYTHTHTHTFSLPLSLSLSSADIFAL